MVITDAINFSSQDLPQDQLKLFLHVIGRYTRSQFFLENEKDISHQLALNIHCSNVGLDDVEAWERHGDRIVQGYIQRSIYIPSSIYIQPRLSISSVETDSFPAA